MHRRCPICDDDGVYVSPPSVPKAGPVVLEEATVHSHDGAAYYHFES